MKPFAGVTNSCLCFTARMIYYFYSFLFEFCAEQGFLEGWGMWAELQWHRELPSSTFQDPPWQAALSLWLWSHFPLAKLRPPVSWVLRKDQLFSPSVPAEVWCEEGVSHGRTFSFTSEASWRKINALPVNALPDLQVPIPSLIFWFSWGRKKLFFKKCQMDKTATSWNVTVNITFRRHLLWGFLAPFPLLLNSVENPLLTWMGWMRLLLWNQSQKLL